MQRMTFVGSLVVWAALLGSMNPALGQETFNLKVGATSGDFPNLDADGIIEGDSGQAFEFDGLMSLESAGITGEEGPQGWSVGIQNEGVEILATTTAGTASAPVANGGFVDGGFVVNELIDPAKNGGKTGAVQAIVLSLTLPVSLPPNSSQKIQSNHYKATIGAADSVAVIRFVDGLIGKGQPVQNNITFQGLTKTPTLGEKQLTLRKKVVAGPEQGNCNDTIDNDLDGKVDCADEDCADDPTFCGVPENSNALCSDGRDNDKDGKTDCDDEDCKPLQVCQAPPENGFDLILNTQGGVRSGLLNVAEISTAPGTEVEVVVSIAPTKNAEPNGAQGWSIAVGHDQSKLEIQGGSFPTIADTDAAAQFSGGFQKTEIVDPARNNGMTGFVSAIVLALVEARTLDPTKNQTIARSKYVVAAGTVEADFPLQVIFKDGLRGSGQPVQNIITVDGNTVEPSNLINLELRKGNIVVPKDKILRRGDANNDGKVNIADPVWIINELVRQGPKTLCRSAADANDDGAVDLSDAMFLIQWRFLGGTAPPAPGGFDCGKDPTEDQLECPEGSATGCPVDA